METMMGKCEYCGSEMDVMAETQAEANKMATDKCDCAGSRIAAKKRMFKERLPEYIGDKATEIDFAPVEKDVYAEIEQIGCMIIEGKLRSATFKVDGTLVTISASGEKITIKRKMSYEQKGEIKE